MTHIKQRKKQMFFDVSPVMNSDRRRRIWFSILNTIIVVAVVIILTFTVLALL